MLVDANSMFAGAASFNRSLCAWGPRLSNETDVTSMFRDSACKFRDSIPSFGIQPIGPFCHDCPGRPNTVQSKVQGPISMPLVPAAVSNLPNGKVLAWAGDMPYLFWGDNEVAGTYTSIFDPATGTATSLRVESTFLLAIWDLQSSLDTNAVSSFAPSSVRHGRSTSCIEAFFNHLLCSSCRQSSRFKLTIRFSFAAYIPESSNVLSRYDESPRWLNSDYRRNFGCKSDDLQPVDRHLEGGDGNECRQRVSRPTSTE